MQLPQLLKQLEYCCCLPSTWRCDVRHPQQVREDQPEQHEPQQRASSLVQPQGQKGGGSVVVCDAGSNIDTSTTGNCGFLRPLSGAPRDVQLPNGTFPAVGVEALELLTLVKGLLRTNSEASHQPALRRDNTSLVLNSSYTPAGFELYCYLLSLLYRTTSLRVWDTWSGALNRIRFAIRSLQGRLWTADSWKRPCIFCLNTLGTLCCTSPSRTIYTVVHLRTAISGTVNTFSQQTNNMPFEWDGLRDAARELAAGREPGACLCCSGICCRRPFRALLRLGRWT